jgi:hypothetical protein
MPVDKTKKLPPSSSRSQASIPGRIVVQPLVWMRCFPAQTLPNAALAILLPILSVVMITALHTGAGVILLLIIAFYAGRRLNRQLQHMRGKMANGCLNPARVISVNPGLIAVYTDLASRPGQEWPVIKVVAQPLGRAGGPPLKTGDRIAVAAYYYGSSGKPHWNDFSPTPVACITADETELREAMARIDADPDGLWDALDRSLAQVPTPTRPGLYWITAPTSPQQPLLSP